MLLIAVALALLVIVAGMKLMAQTQKDNLGNLYKYVSWFVVIMGFLCLIGAGLHCAMKCCKMHHERMEGRGDMMYGHEGCERGMMNCNHGMMGGGCMMMNHGGCDQMMGGHCDKMNGSCNEGMQSGCNMSEGGTCPMMKGGMHCEEKDSVIEKKEMKK